MFGVYLFAAVVGWPFVLFFLFFGGDADADFDLDIHADLDLEADFDADVGLDHGGGLGVGDFLSVRGVAFGLAFFGLTGIVLDMLDANLVLGLLAALAVAALAVVLNARLVLYLKESSSGSVMSDRELQGALRKVVISIDDASKGRIAVDHHGQRLYFVAKPFRAGKGRSFAVGEQVVVIEVDRGTALVSAMESLES